MRTPDTTPPDARDAFFDVSDLEKGAGGRAGRASILVLAMSLLKVVLHLGSTVILARLVPPAEYGIAALALPVAIIVSNMAQFGLAQPIVQMKVVTHALVSTLFWVNLALGVFFGTLMVAFSGLAARYYNTPEVGPVFMVLGISVLFSSILTQYIAMLRRRMQIKLLEYGMLVSFALSLVIAVIAAFFGASYWAIVLQQTLQPVLNVLIYAVYLRWVPSSLLKTDLRTARGALNFGGNIAIANLLQQIGQALPVILIGRHYTPFEAGLYQRSNTMARLIPARAVTPLASVFVSTLSRLQHDGPAFRAMFQRMLMNMNLILMPLGVLAFTTSDILVPLALGPDWAPTAPVLAWLCLLLLQNSFDQGVTWALNACGASRQIRTTGVIGLILVIAVLAVVGFDRPVVVLAATLMLANQFIRLPINAVLALRHTHVDMKTILRGYVLDLAVAGGAIGLVLLLRHEMAAAAPWVQLGAACLLVAILYAIRIVVDPEIRRDVVRVLGTLGHLGKN